ncbi:MAG: MFS transporter [Aquificaceae bacterium]|uniref:MFS transporter n=1 Tax=Hydrogenobacter sp. Uz 6-8 TaxID=3384828 RepID=UPI0030A0A6E8
MKRKFKLLSFALYDSGETVLGALLFSTLYPLYITQHVDVKTYSVLYGIAFFISFLVALQLGRIADHRGLRKGFFTLFSLCVPLLCLTLFISFNRAELNFVLYLLLAIFHQQALVFYNSLLKSFETKGFASGFGVALGYAGSALSLIFLAPVLTLPSAFVWVGLIFFLLSLPSVVSLSEPEERQKVVLRELFRDRGFLLTMASMLLLMELAHTMIAMMGVYLREVYGLSERDIYRTIGFSALGGISGGLLFGRLTDRISAQRLFPLGFLLWSAFLLLLYITPRDFLLPLGFFAGLCLAHLWTTSRILLLERFTRGDVAVRFSFYSLSERIASSLGLIFWSFFLLITGENYRLSALLMLIFPSMGALLYLLSNRRFEVKRL